MKYPSIFFIVFVLLLIGAGCKGSDNTKNATSTPEEAVVNTTLQQEAYLFCTQKGYDIQIRFVSGENKNVSYCVFGNNKECESVAFMKGTCSDKESTPTSTEDGTVSMFEPGPGDAFPLRLCEPVAKPVCGKDNKTYTNPCVAQFLNVAVDHDGNCERTVQEEETEPVPTVNENPIVDVSKVTETVRRTFSPNKTNKNWIEIPSSLLKASTDQNSTVERCESNGAVTFMVKTGCPENCFSTLYNTAGEVMCYPDNDIDNSCPEYIQSSGYKNSCTRMNK